MNTYGADRGVGLVFRLEGRFTRCALQPELAERMVRRFLEAMIDHAGDGENLTVKISPHGGQCGIAVLRPSTLRDVAIEELFGAGVGDEEQGPVGLGFSFRLVRGLAQSVGGGLHVDAEQLVLLLPAKP
jgi:hypothetical protein